MTESTASSRAEVMTGRRFGNYRLVAGLGQGGMARVFLALSDKLAGFQKLFVLKVLRSDVAGDPEFIAMFLDEARLAARLNHPNVVHTYEVGEDEGRYFIAMEYLEGQSLSSIAARVGRENIPLPLHLRILSDTLAGLHYAHELDDYEGKPLTIVHRDVSPQNVFVTYAGQAKLLDFGIAKASGAISSTRQGIVKGKLGYMAPEQALGQAVDRRTDIYAIGIMLWEAIAGRRLVTRDEPESLVLERRVAGGDPKITDVAADVPTELAAICDKAMRTEASERYATAAEMRRELEQYLQRLPAPDSEAMAAYLEKHFAADRRKVRQLVEDQVKGVAAEKSSLQPLVVLGTNEPVSTPTIDTLEAPPTTILPATPARRRFSFGRGAASGLAIALIASACVWLTANRRPRPTELPQTESAPSATGAPSASTTPTERPAASVSAVVEPPSNETSAPPAESAPKAIVRGAPLAPRSTPTRPSTSARPSASPAEPSPAPSQTTRTKRTVDETNPY